MTRVLVDTSFLISLASPPRDRHAVAVEWFRYFVEKAAALELSTLVVAEFEVRQAITDLPLQNFNILPFNISHARKAAQFHRALLNQEVAKDADDQRDVVINDLKILGQASAEEINIVLTEDERTLTKYAWRLRDAGLCHVTPLLLKDGFQPGRLENPDQNELNLTSTEIEKTDDADESSS